MKIGFDAKRYFNNSTGLGNYARWLVNNLIAENKNKYHLYQPSESGRTVTNATIHYPQGIFSYLKSLWRIRYIISDLLKDKIDIFHGLTNELPFGIHKTGIKTVVTIHDLINKRYPDYYSLLDRWIYDKKLRYAQQYADIIITPSLQTKKDLIHFYDTPEDKIEVIPLSIPKSKNKATSESSTRYVLCVSSFNKRKNLDYLIQAFNNLKDNKLDLIIAGSKGDTTEQITDMVKDNKRIKLLFDVSDDKLSELYSAAIFCIYPSLFEGFGIPILEAFSYGKTVATSNISSMPEVGGDAAVYFDPNDIDSISSSLLQLSDINTRKSLENKINARMQLFDSSTLIEKYNKIYLSLKS